MTTRKIADVFLKNRAELLPEDVWGRYIVPPLFNRKSVFSERKSLRIQGGRGCGKTMFLRYLCHTTRFSSSRNHVPVSEFAHLGLYWRPDTQFCGLMKEAWLGERDAQFAFIHYATLVILDEVARCFDSIAAAKLEGGPCDLRKMQLPPAVKEYLGAAVSTVESLKDFSCFERAKLEKWVQNPESARPTMLRFEFLLEQIAEMAARADGRLQALYFRIFVDEFENLQDHQRKLVCDYVKHPRKWFNVSFAMRQHAITQFLTSGSEQIVENHDVFTIDVEAELGRDGGRDFQLLAAEFLLLALSQAPHRPEFAPFEPANLVDESSLPHRISKDYRAAVIGKARQLLPSLTSREVAQRVFKDDSLHKRLRDMIDKGLKLHREDKLSPDLFLMPDLPEASIVAGAVVNRTKPGPQAVLAHLQGLAAGTETSAYFDGLIDNNLHGCLFYLYIGLPRRPNLLYGGFERFCELASPNLRFFQQLCQAAYSLAEDQAEAAGASFDLEVPVDVQAMAAEQVGELSLHEIERLGLQGTQLLDIMKRLGRLFAAAHRRPSQSEVEINHFSIDQSDRVDLSPATRELIRQAKIWSVFYEEGDTKNKSNYDIAQNDIIPNPIFSPYFRISYRKKKKITLTAAQVNVIMTGSGDQFEAVLREYAERWRVGDDEDVPVTRGLF
jgi:hypothetical protein